MTPTQQVVSRVEAFTKLYSAFYEYFVEELRRDATPFNQYQLQLATQYFEGIELQKRVFPLFGTMSSNVAEKQACARAALYQALVAHSFSSHLASTSQTLFNVTNGLADELQAVKALLGKLSTKSDRIQEKIDAISKREQTVARKKEGSKKQDDSLGS